VGRLPIEGFFGTEKEHEIVATIPGEKKTREKGFPVGRQKGKNQEGKEGGMYVQWVRF